MPEVHLTLTDRAAQLLNERAPGPRQRGKYISELIEGTPPPQTDLQRQVVELEARLAQLEQQIKQA